MIKENYIGREDVEMIKEKLKQGIRYIPIFVLLLVVLFNFFPNLIQGALEKGKDGYTLKSFVFLSNQITCAVGSTKYPIPVEAEALSVKSISTNTGKIWVGDATTATSSAGYELSPGESISFGGQGLYIASNSVYVAADTGGDKICWARLN